MKNLALIFMSLTVAIAVIASIPFCLSEKRIQKRLQVSRGGKKINYV